MIASIVNRLLFGSALLFAAMPSGAVYTFVSVDYPGNEGTDVRGLDNNGRVSGYTWQGSQQYGFVYGPAGFAPMAPLPDGGVFAASGMNDAGYVVGSTLDPQAQAAYIYQGGTYTFYSHGGWQHTDFRTISNNGLVTGTASNDPFYEIGNSIAFIFNPSTGTYTDISFGAVGTTIAHGINDAGQVVGSVVVPGEGAKAFLREVNGSTSTFQIDGKPTYARGINNHGLIAGFISVDGHYQAFVGNSGGYEVIQFPGATDTAVEGLNDAGQISGLYWKADGVIHGFVATPATMPIGTAAGGAYVYNAAVVANTPIFFDPPVAIGYDYATGAGDPNFATFSPPIGIGDSRYAVVVGAQKFPVAGGEVFDFRTHGFPSGVSAFGLRGIEMSALVDPASAQAFPAALSFVASGNFTGTQTPITVQQIVVTNKNDSGVGSLRGAVAQANADPGPNLITFDPSIMGTIVLTNGQIQIAGETTIIGPGADKLAIDGNASSRVIIVAPPTPPAPVCPALSAPEDFLVSISGLTIQNGLRPTDNTAGGIYAEQSLTLDSMVFKNNVAKGGGGVTFATQYPGQSLTITNSEFRDNVAKPASNPVTGTHQGAGVNVSTHCSVGSIPTWAPDVTVTIRNSRFVGNRAQPAVGGLNGRGSALSFYLTGSVTIEDSTFDDNHVDLPDPLGAFSYLGGAIHGFATSLDIRRTTISNNSALSGGALNFVNDWADFQTPETVSRLRVENSTISGNSAVNAGGAFNLIGNVDARFVNSTIAYNNAAAARTSGVRISTQATTPPSAGNASPPTVTIQSSIVSRGSAGTTDFGRNDGVIPSATFNVDHSIYDSSQAGTNVSGSANIVGSDPLLGPLANNGGATKTHALNPGSPARNAGANPLALTTDQRYPLFARVVGAAADIGAFEAGEAAPPALVSAVSRRTHGSAGTFDLALALLPSSPTIEPRLGPVQNLVFTLDKATSSFDVAVTEGVATIGTPSYEGNDIVVPLTGVNNQQYVTVTLSNILGTDGGAGGTASIRVGYLLGDVNASRVVTLGDLAQVNSVLAQPVSAANFTRDVNVNGTLTLADKAIANANLTRNLPAP